MWVGVNLSAGELCRSRGGGRRRRARMVYEVVR